MTEIDVKQKEKNTTLLFSFSGTGNSLYVALKV